MSLVQYYLIDAFSSTRLTYVGQARDTHIVSVWALQVRPEKEELEEWIVKDMDRLLGEAWLTGNEDAFQQIFHLILNENVSGNFASAFQQLNLTSSSLED